MKLLKFWKARARLFDTGKAKTPNRNQLYSKSDIASIRSDLISLNAEAAVARNNLESKKMKERVSRLRSESVKP